MGISVKHVFVVSVILSVAGFVYVIGFAEIDAVRSPRAAALEAQPSSWRLIQNVRAGLTNGQVAGARAAGDELVRLYPEDPRSWLNRGYAYRVGGVGGEEGVESAELESWERLLELVEGLDASGSRTGLRQQNWLYHRGWGLRGLGRVEESRGYFARLARAVEQANGVEGAGDESGDGADDGGGSIEIGAPGVGPGTAYNLACYWSVAGDMDRALAYWEVCVARGYTGAGSRNGVGAWWMVDPDLEDLRVDARFPGGGGDGGGDGGMGGGGVIGGDASIGDE